jgi:ferredoxin
MSTLKVRVDLEKCIGAGHCVLRAPTIFDQRDDGMVILLDVPGARTACSCAQGRRPVSLPTITIEETP